MTEADELSQQIRSKENYYSRSFNVCYGLTYTATDFAACVSLLGKNVCMPLSLCTPKIYITSIGFTVLPSAIDTHPIAEPAISLNGETSGNKSHPPHPAEVTQTSCCGIAHYRPSPALCILARNVDIFSESLKTQRGWRHASMTLTICYDGAAQMFDCFFRLNGLHGSGRVRGPGREPCCCDGRKK
jgi:hypothetical protein